MMHGYALAEHLTPLIILNVEIVKKIKINLEQVTLERELWNAALRTPPPYTPKTTYTRKGKNRFKPFRDED